MEKTVEAFFENMREMIQLGRPAWQKLALMCDDDPDVNVEEVIMWLTDIDEGNDL